MVGDWRQFTRRGKEPGKKFQRRQGQGKDGPQQEYMTDNKLVAKNPSPSLTCPPDTGERDNDPPPLEKGQDQKIYVVPTLRGGEQERQYALTVSSYGLKNKLGEPA